MKGVLEDNKEGIDLGSELEGINRAIGSYVQQCNFFMASCTRMEKFSYHRPLFNAIHRQISQDGISSFTLHLHFAVCLHL